jgi:hypothetical protein
MALPRASLLAGRRPFHQALLKKAASQLVAPLIGIIRNPGWVRERVIPVGRATNTCSTCVPSLANQAPGAHPRTYRRLRDEQMKDWQLVRGRIRAGFQPNVQSTVTLSRALSRTASS